MQSSNAAVLAPDAFVDRLRQEGASRYHDEHPFHVRMHEGALTRWELYRNMPVFDCSNTLEGLSSTSITCAPMGADLLDVYLSYLVRSGFLDAPPGGSPRWAIEGELR